MVRQNHLQIILFSLLLITSQHLLARQDDFQLLVTQPTVELGKPVWVNIITRQTTPSLATLDFSTLVDRFEVIKDNNEIHQTSNGQRWRIRLYPRDKGRLTLPALRFHRHSSQPVKLQVGSAVDHKTGQAFGVDYQISNLNPWIRQQVLVSYTISHHESRLVLNPLESPNAEMLVIPLSTSTQQQAGIFKHSSGWAIYARKSGKHNIKLPALNYIRDGVISHRFYPAKIQFDIKPLPTYLPGNIPVGQLHMDVIQKPSLVLKNRLEAMTLVLVGQGIPQALLPDIRHFFKSSQQLSIYPVETRSQQTTISAVTSQHRYRLPFKATAQGTLSLPSARLNYFDPVTGKLATLELKQQQTYSIAIGLLILLLIILIAASLLLTNKLYHWLIPKWRCLRIYRQALKTLAATQTPAQFKSLTTQLSLGEGWPANLSLRQWAARHRVDHAAQARQICLQLETALYRAEGTETAKLRVMFTHLCLNRWPILRWSHLPI